MLYNDSMTKNKQTQSDKDMKKRYKDLSPEHKRVVDFYARQFVRNHNRSGFGILSARELAMKLIAFVGTGTPNGAIAAEDRG